MYIRKDEIAIRKEEIVKRGGEGFFYRRSSYMSLDLRCGGADNFLLFSQHAKGQEELEVGFCLPKRFDPLPSQGRVAGIKGSV